MNYIAVCGFYCQFLEKSVMGEGGRSSIRTIPKVRSPKSCRTVCAALDNTVECVVSPTLSKCAHTEIGCLVLARQLFVMELSLSTTIKCKVCAVIRFLNGKGNTPIEKHLKVVSGVCI